MDTQENMELGDLNDDSDQDPAVKDFLGKIDPELFNDDKGGIISEDIFNLVQPSKIRKWQFLITFSTESNHKGGVRKPQILIT